jgi:hypothetical protein
MKCAKALLSLSGRLGRYCSQTVLQHSLLQALELLSQSWGRLIKSAARFLVNFDAVGLWLVVDNESEEVRSGVVTNRVGDGFGIIDVVEVDVHVDEAVEHGVGIGRQFPAIWAEHARVTTTSAQHEASFRGFVTG